MSEILKVMLKFLIETSEDKVIVTLEVDKNKFNNIIMPLLMNTKDLFSNLQFKTPENDKAPTAPQASEPTTPSAAQE